jgi:hypothetical protein
VLAIKGNRRYNCLQDLIFSTDDLTAKQAKSEILKAGI